MDLNYLQSILPNAEEETLATLLSAHQQELSDLTAANAQLQQDLSRTRYDYALEQETAGLHFSSNAAKTAFLTAAREKNLPLENGRLQGFADFRQQFEETDPGAFSKKVVVVKDTGGGGSGSENGTVSALRRAFGLK